MGVFDNCSMLLELKHLSIKEKKKLKSAVTENGGSISFVVNQQCSLVVTSDVSNLSSSRLRSIQKHQTPVVGLDYVHSCVERGTLLPVDGYKLDPSSTPSAAVNPPRRAPLTYQADPPNNQISLVPAERTDKEKFRIHTELDSDPPPFPSDFQVAKYSIFEKADRNSWCVLELQSARTEQGQRYRVVRYWKDDVATKEAAVKDQLVFLSTSEKALEVYEALRDQLDSSGLQRRSSIPPEVPHLGSAPLQQLLLEETLSSGSLSQEVGVFVEMLWTEALGCLNHILRVSINKLSLNDVSRAEGLLLQAQKKLKEGDQTNLLSLLKEVYILLPHREPQPPLPTAKFLSQKLDLCQLIRDVLNVSEMTLRSSQPSSVGKYRALQCSIEAIAPNSIVFQNIASLLNDSPVQIHQIMRVSRGVELQTFKSELGNIRPLLHSSSPSNFVGILSRGLLLPRVGVEHHGIERTDVGNLGSGIYFSDAVSTSLKYSKPGETDGSRLLLVCDVALGRCKDVHRRDQTLSQAPEGHHSVHGVRRTHSNQSDFEDNEFVVYSPDQVKVKYVVQFTVEGDHLKDFHPAVNTSAELSHAAVDEELVSVEDIENIKNPLEDVKAGLLDSSGQQLPLQAVHVKCKLMDLLSQVIIFQKYTNLSSVPIEAKYVFPLDDSAAVCGFEAFINGKHVVGQVKEKETARKEYKQAIEKGHGAYLMDQDAPDVFTISVGNLPPGATVLIKVTFVSELVVKDGSILFSLPGSVAPWQESAALNQTTQVSVEKVCVTDEAAGVREFTLDVSVEMPHEISNLLCITHQVKMKRTDCKAVVRVLPDQVMGPDGFQLSITLSEVHLPRMWVEKHPDKDSQACMLVFYPDFELDSGSEVEEVVLLLDTSESMRGESLRLAQNIALQVLRKLENNVRVNVVLFGTDHTEALLKAQPLVEVRQTAERFIKRCSPAGGSTELWRPLKALSLLPPSRGARNLLLLSDGHIQNSALTLQLLRDNVQHSRLFTCGLSPTANRHMLRALAQAGGGAYEFFDTKTKHNWAEKVLRQVKRMSSPGCSSVSVKWQQFNPTAPSPVQAPKQLHALFRDCHTLVYGFVPHCTQATLLGNLQGQELKTMVSTSELQKTRGTFLHKLTARALIRDYEDGSLDTTEAEHEGKKAELKSFIIELSKEFSILSQFTSFVAIEERDSNETEDGVTDIPKLIEEEDVDFLPYISWTQDSVGLDMSSINDDLGDDMEMSSINDDLGDDMEASVSSFNFQVAYYKLRDEDDDDEVEVRSKSFLKTAEEQETPEEQQMKNGYKPQFHLPRVIQSPCRSELPFRQPYLKTKFICTGAPEPLTYLSSAPTPESAQASLASVSRMGSEALEGAGGLFGSAPTSPEPAPSASTAPTFGPQLLDMAQNGSPLSAGGLYGLSQIPRIAFGDLSSGSLPHFPRSRQAGFQFHSPPSDEASRVTSPPSPKDEDPNLDCDLRYDVRRSQRRMLEKSVMKKSSVEMDIIKCGSNLSSSFTTFSKPQAAIVVGSVSARVSDPPAPPPPAPPPPARVYARAMAFAPPPPPARVSDPPAPPPPARVYARAMAFASPPPPARVYARAMAFAPPPPLVYAHAKAFAPPPPPARVSDPPAPPPPARVYAHAKAFAPPPPPAMESAPPQLHLLSHVLHEKKFVKKQGYQGEQEHPEKMELDGCLKRRPSKRKGKTVRHHGRQSSVYRDPDPEDLKYKWTKIFQLQHSDGFWELTNELGHLINLNVDVLSNVFLKNKGIYSLGMKAHDDVLRMVATLLVLQLLRLEKQEEGKLLQSLFRLEESTQFRPERWDQVKKAVDWVCWADQNYPCICSRLELGLSWDSSTRQLLGFDSLPPFSALIGLELQRSAAPQLI